MQERGGVGMWVWGPSRPALLGSSLGDMGDGGQALTAIPRPWDPAPTGRGW